MGRSVSYANDSLLVAYAEWWQPDPAYIADERVDLEEPDYYPEPDQDEFQWWADWVQETACTYWPSFAPIEQWLDREDKAIAENDLGYIGVSEYCGVASVWFTPKPNSWEYSDTHNREQLARGFAVKIAARFYATFATLDRIGGFSDGTSYYHRKEVAA
jgi:hypothetical protein